MSKTPQIFLSYAREDEPRVKDLYQRLSGAGVKPWMASKDILAGRPWKKEIPTAIQQSDFFLICLSSHSAQKRGVIQEEIREALETWRKKLEDDIYLIPARLEICEVPDALAAFQWVDLFEEDGWPRLLEAIRAGTERLGLGGSGQGSASGLNDPQAPGGAGQGSAPAPQTPHTPDSADQAIVSVSQKPQTTVGAGPGVTLAAQMRYTPGGLAIATPENLAWLLAQSQQRIWWEKATMELFAILDPHPAGRGPNCQQIMGTDQAAGRLGRGVRIANGAKRHEKRERGVWLDRHCGRLAVAVAVCVGFLGTGQPQQIS